jgi:GNAT superfamily N-acetyltransferase
MPLRAERVKLPEIQALRALFLQEINAQVRYDACHARGWSDSYLLSIDGAPVGYGAVKGRERADRDTVFEFFVVPSYRRHSSRLFGELIAVSGVRYVECQSNDFGLSALLHEFAHDIGADTILFADHCATSHAIAGAVFRRKRKSDEIFAHMVEPEGEFVVEFGDEVVATGGFLLHYNIPFADLYMEVREDQRRRGFASFLLQEVKRECYLAGRVPAARCGLENVASRAALTKAGLRVCGFMLLGVLGSPAA